MDDGEKSMALVPLKSAHAPAPLVIDDLVVAFLSRRSPNTRRAYDADLRQFAAFLGEPAPAAALDRLIALGPAHANHAMLRYRDQMAEAGLASSTRNRRLAAVRAALKLGRTLGLLTWALEIRNDQSVAYRETAGPGEAAYRRMLEVADAREASIIRLLHDLGLRRGELTGLDVCHLDLQASRVSVLGKGREDRVWITMPKPTAATLRAWIAERGESSGPLFTARSRHHGGHRLSGEAVRLIVAALARRAGLTKPVRPHGLRHTAITRGLELTNGDVRKVRMFSRHKNIQTLTVYDDARRDLAGEVASLVAGDQD